MRLFKYFAVFVVAGAAYCCVIYYLSAVRLGRAMDFFEGRIAQAPSKGFDEIVVRTLLFPGALLEGVNVLPQGFGGLVSIAFYASLVTFLFFLMAVKRGTDK